MKGGAGQTIPQIIWGVGNDGTKVITVKTKEEKINQNRFFFWYKRENQGWIKQRLEKAKRPDLIEKLLGSSSEKSPSKVPTWLEEKRKKSK
jgi:hypothetical protein